MRFQYLVQHGAKMAFKVLGRLPFNKNSIHMPNGTVHSGCTEPTQLSHCMFGFVLESSRIRKTCTVDNNFVKWKGTFWSD